MENKDREGTFHCKEINGKAKVHWMNHSTDNNKIVQMFSAMKEIYYL